MGRNRKPLIYEPGPHGLPVRILTDSGRLRCRGAVPEGSGSIHFKQCRLTARGYLAGTDTGLCGPHLPASQTQGGKRSADAEKDARHQEGSGGASDEERSLLRALNQALSAAPGAGG